MGLFSSKKQTTTLEEMISPEQKKAREALMNYGMTGATPAGYNAGEAYDLSGFNYGLSPYEQLGLSSLLKLQGAEAPGITKSRDILTKMANLEFNPEDVSTGLGSFKKALSREIGTANDVLNREAAITGNRYSSDIVRQKGDLAARQSEMIASKLADLFGAQQDRAFNAASNLANIEQTAGALEQNRLAQLFDYGTLQRQLANQQAQQAYDERQRQRDEQLATLGTLQSVYGQNNNWGVKEYTTKTPSMFSQLSGITLGAAGMALGGPIGGAIGSSIGRLFAPKTGGGGGAGGLGGSVMGMLGGSPGLPGGAMSILE